MLSKNPAPCTFFVYDRQNTTMRYVWLMLGFLIFATHAQCRSDFEKMGDTLTLMPVPTIVVSESMGDWEGMWQLILGTLASQGTIEMIKSGFDFAHKKGYSVAFAKRPCCDSYKGMPSGHAGGAASAAGFVFYRYGWKPALPLMALSIVTSASRVYAEKHSVWQVLAGSAIAWGFAALFTTPYSDSSDNSIVKSNRPKRQFFIFPIVGRDRFYNTYYKLGVSYVF